MNRREQFRKEALSVDENDCNWTNNTGGLSASQQHLLWPEEPSFAKSFSGRGRQALHTDIPVLDDLFSELNSDAGQDTRRHFTLSKPYHQHHNHQGFEGLSAVGSVPRSEPVDLADIENILLPGYDSRRKHSVRQSFSSRLSSAASSLAVSRERLAASSSHGDALYSGEKNPFLADDGFAEIFNFAKGSGNGMLNAAYGQQSRSTTDTPGSAASMIRLQDAAMCNDGKIQVKVIGGRNGRVTCSTPRSMLILPTPAATSYSSVPSSMTKSRPLSFPVDNASRAMSSGRQVPVFHDQLRSQDLQSHSAHPRRNPPTAADVPLYRSFGKKRYIIGPEYADFVCRLQNDIPFDSSDDDDDCYGNQAARSSSKRMRRPGSRTDSIRDEEDTEAFDSVDEAEDEEEEFRSGPDTKISSQELLELFEDQCQGLRGNQNAPVSASLIKRKQQIALKGYRPSPEPAIKTAGNEEACTDSSHSSAVQRSNTRSLVAMEQRHFDMLQGQLHRHFQFLVQNLALSNELEGGEAVTLISLKLLVQLHLHMDSTCNLLRGASALGSSFSSGGSIDLSLISAAATCSDGSVSLNSRPSPVPILPKNLRTISCLNATPMRASSPTADALRLRNPISSRLADLVPLGISKVAVIAGFLARPAGQKQVLSLAVLRADTTLKPKSSSLSLSLRVKAHPQLAGPTLQLLSNAFYNIITLFHDYIDLRLLERTVGADALGKCLELPQSRDALVLSANSFTSSREDEQCMSYGESGEHCMQDSGSIGASAGGKSAKFLVSEDGLLLCGLKRFGCGNWESVQAQFLPNRSSRQLAIRYKNLSSRRTPMNPVKAFNEQMMLPLNEIEEDLLYRGVQRFGKEFCLISRHYLPHRPATILRKLWRAMDDARRAKE